MTSALYQEVLEKGFNPQLVFRNDDHLKLLYIVNRQGRNVRVSATGPTKQPPFALENQNPSMKDIVGGVRVHLAAVLN